MLFFEETAEELINRLFEEWQKENTFPKNAFLTSPNFKSDLIKRLEGFDNHTQEGINKIPDIDSINQTETEKEYWEEYFLNRRKEFIFINFINKIDRIYTNILKKNPPPKPTHQPPKRHLRLVVSNR